MAMGITQALKLQEGPISTLAQLPQQQIIAMAQQRRIPADMVSVILNEKAEMEQAAANMQAMAKPMPASVTERNMAINAQAEAMRNQPQMQPQMMAMAPQQQMPMDAGISSLPVDDSMYKLAGGGIVAFQEGGETEGLGDTFFGSEQMQYVYPDTRTRAEKERDYAYERYFKDQQKMRDVFSGKEFLDRNLAEKRIGLESARALQAQDGARPPLPTAAPAIRPSTPPAAAAPKPKATTAKPPVAAEATKPAATEKDADKPKKSFTEFMAESGRYEEDPAMAEIRAKLATMGGESQLDRQQARNMALLQAGLGIMAGTSPYALSNIGAGAMKGTEAYASSMKDIKAAEKDLFKMQADLARADQARKDGNIKAFEEYTDKAERRAMDLRKLGSEERLTEAQISKMEADKQYLAGQLRQLGVNERLINAQINNLNKPGEIQQRIDAYKADPKAFAEAMRLSRATSETGLDNLQFKLYQAAEAHVNNPVTLASEPKLSALIKKAKGGDTKAMEELEAYKDKLRREYIRRNTPPGGLRAPSANAGAGAGSVDANNPLLRGN